MEQDLAGRALEVLMKVILTIIKILFILILILALAVGTGLGLLTIFQYNPDDTENVVLTGQSENSPEQGKPFRIMTWNIGYGALGDNADFFMDGGKMVNTADEERVRYNLDGITEGIIEDNADIYMLQEVDRDADRSHNIDEAAEITNALAEIEDKSYQTMFANNFKALFVPFPIPPIGKVNSGIYTASDFRCQRADRIQLPSPFKWPVSTANFKRCLLVTRIRLSGSSRYLVLINAHLEGYDVEDGSGKEAQTKVLMDVMQKEYDDGNYVIVGGDFNQTFNDVDTADYPVYEGTWQPGTLDVDEFIPEFIPAMDPVVPTCRSLDKVYDKANDEHQFYMTDGFIYSKNVRMNSIETKDLEFEYSDHNPVVAEFELK